MTLRQLEIFIVTAGTLNLREAAHNLHIAQSAISHHLRVLQEEFGTQLHRKTGAGIELTAAGIVFLKEAKAIISQVDRIKENIRGLNPESIPRRLVVGGNHAVCAKLLPLLFSKFKKIHSDIDLTLKTEHREVLERLILGKKIELAVVQIPASNPSLTSERLPSSDSLVAFVSAKHPYVAKRRWDAEDFARCGFIIRAEFSRSGVTRRFLRSMDANGIEAKVLMDFNSAESIKVAVQNTAGIGILLRENIEGDINAKQFKEIKIPGVKVYAHRYVIYPKIRPLSPWAQEFLRMLRTYRSK